VPGLNFSLYDTRSKDIVAGLLDHRFDFGFVRKSAVVAPLKYTPLGKISYALYAPPGWKTADPKRRKLAVTEGVEFLKELIQAAAQKKKTLRPTHLCTNFTQAAQLVRSGVAAAILPVMVESVLKDCTTRSELPWLSKYRREIGLAWHERLLDLRPKARELLKSLKEILIS
jgi:DNA-binding transcriptional LysR family regulator